MRWDYLGLATLPSLAQAIPALLKLPGALRLSYAP